ncbi:DUF3859 domain-containing protein [Jannaschia pohangensis]|uniref:DUF3859 domain-containing protein n=1 Tax=Jannaschia pohangensis TaxID=390807 RepID=A0A1I3LGF6_9RHOB|nr:DUF3859 domain-containing protein [Jannaschia pohangensis]SFI83791.1 protein of unknown function [Jannaschia pohangensis]
MRNRLTALTFCLALLGGAFPVFAQVQLVETGIICPDTREGRLIDAPGTEAGFVRVLDGLDFDMPGRIVPLVPDLAFGIRVRLKDDVPRDVTMITRHPPMGANGVTEQVHISTLPADDTYIRVYSFDFDYEMLPGVWTLAVADGDDLLLSVDFEVVEAYDPRIDNICGFLLQS